MTWLLAALFLACGTPDHCRSIEPNVDYELAYRIRAECVLGYDPGGAPGYSFGLPKDHGEYDAECGIILSADTDPDARYLDYIHEGVHLLLKIQYGDPDAGHTREEWDSCDGF